MAFDHVQSDTGSEENSTKSLSINDVGGSNDGFELPSGFYSLGEGQQAAQSVLDNFAILDSNENGSIDSRELEDGVIATDDADVAESFEKVQRSYNLISLLAKDRGGASGISKADLQAMNSPNVPEYNFATKGKLYYKSLDKREALEGAALLTGGLALTKVTFGGGIVVTSYGSLKLGKATKEAYIRSNNEQENLKKLYL